MKKFFTALFAAILSVFAAVGISACSGGDPKTVSVYMPDGAPALALASLMSEEEDVRGNVTTEYHVVDATTIQTFVSGENPAADICVLPVNAACKILGSGESYKLVGTVTHGNLYLMKKASGADITKENLNTLVGKTVGVINLAAFPGFTFKLILNDNSLAFKELGNDGVPEADKVNLKAISADEAIPGNAACDYFVVPEPAASTKQSKTEGKLSIAGDLQKIYNEGSGYPQAVMVCKNTLLEENSKYVEDFLASVKKGADWLAEAEPETIASAVSSHLTEGTTPTFNAQNLTRQVIANCAVSFVPASECKGQVTSFIDKLIAVQSAASAKPADTFFYAG